MANAPAHEVLAVGSVLADTYTLEALIGRGGMGAVYLASHRRLPGKQVAIKVLHADVADDGILARFRREATIASQLSHPNIVEVHDFNVTADGTPYLVLEYLVGETLADRLRAGPLPLDHALSIVREVGSALAAAHRIGVVHRDLKPQNIFLMRTELDGRVIEVAKVLDFGISKMRASQTVKTVEHSLLGTPQYMSPEQATGRHTVVDERTDVFAVGAIVYEMLAGRPAFSGASIPEVVFKVVYEQPAALAQLAPDVPDTVVAAVERAMAKAIAQRFASVSALVEALTGEPLSLPGAAVTRGGGAAPASVRSGSVAGGSGGGVVGGGGTADSRNDPMQFAETHGASASGGSVPPLAAPTGETVRSISSPVPKVSMPLPGQASRESAKSIAADTASTEASKRGAPRPVLAIAIGIAVIAAAVAIYLVVTRPSEQPRVAPSPPADAANVVAVVAVDAMVAPTPPTPPADAAMVVVVAPPDAAIARDASVPPVQRPTRPSGGNSAASEDDDAQDLDVIPAEQALQNHRYDDAIHEANRLLDGSLPPKRAARVLAIRALAYCAKNEDPSAQTDLRSIMHTVGKGSAYQRVKRNCPRIADTE